MTFCPRPGLAVSDPEEEEWRRRRWLMVGTRKGLWIGRSTSSAGRRGRARSRTSTCAARSTPSLVDTRGGDRPRLFWPAQRRAGTGAAGAPLRRPRRHLGRTAPDGAIRFPEDTGRDARARSGSSPPGTERRTWSGPAPSPAACSAPSDGGETFTLERALWDHPHRERVGRRLRRPGLPHAAAAPDRPALGDRGDLDRRGLPDHRRRRLVGAAQPGHPGRVPARGRSSTPSSASACTRSTRAPVAPRAALPRRTTAGSTAPTTRAALDVDRRRAARRLRLPDRRAPARARHRLRLPARRRRGPLPDPRATRGSGAPATPGDLGAAGRGRRRAAQRLLRRRHARRDVRRRPRRDRALRRGRNGTVCGSFDGGATWRELVRDLPDVMVVRAARTA